MGRSQRHKIAIQNTSSRGEIYAQGKVAPAVLLSATPATPTVPAGPAGGPLQGSSMMGAVPLTWITPTPHDGEAPGPQLLEGQIPAGIDPSTRALPLGPFSLLRVEPVADPVGVRYVLSFDDGQILEEGDTVLVEATGSTPVNGTYTVAELADSETETTFFVPGTVLPAQIDAKGRVTVTDGA